MAKFIAALLATALVGAHGALAAPPSKSANPYNLQPYKINLSKNVPHMLDMIKRTELPAEPQYPGLDGSMGIDLEDLKDLRESWLRDFNWKKEEATMNKSVPPL